MITLVRTTSDNNDFIGLVKLLDAELSIRDGEDHTFYAQFNKIDTIRHTVVAYDDEQPVGCGAIKAFSSEAMEVKRMYVRPEERKKGIAAAILSELERWAVELSRKKCVLETGRKQPEAIALYSRHGYKQIENYGQYAGVENSICFEKRID